MRVCAGVMVYIEKRMYMEEEGACGGWGDVYAEKVICG